MNISNSDRVKKWIGASSAGPRGPATRASRLSLTGVCLGKELNTSRLRPTPTGTRKTIEENPAIEPTSAVATLPLGSRRRARESANGRSPLVVWAASAPTGVWRAPIQANGPRGNCQTDCHQHGRQRPSHRQPHRHARRQICMIDERQRCPTAAGASNESFARARAVRGFQVCRDGTTRPRESLNTNRM